MKNCFYNPVLIAILFRCFLKDHWWCFGFYDPILMVLNDLLLCFCLSWSSFMVFKWPTMMFSLSSILFWWFLNELRRCFRYLGSLLMVYNKLFSFMLRHIVWKWNHKMLQHTFALISCVQQNIFFCGISMSSFIKMWVFRYLINYKDNNRLKVNKFTNIV